MNDRQFTYVGALLVAVSVLLGSFGSTAAEYPSKSITFLVPYSAGGSTDLTVRALAKGAEDDLGQPITVINRPGGGGAIMLSELAKAKPDGYTIGNLVVNTNAIAPHMQKVPFDPVNDFTPIMTYGGYTTFIAVLDDSPFQSLQEMIEYSKANPRLLTVGVSQIGAVSHLGISRLAQEEGMDVTFVPFGGGSPAVAALMGGHVSTAVTSGEILAQVRAGKARALALMNDAKIEEFPKIKNIRELGYNWALDAWLGIGGPKGLPSKVMKKLETAFLKAMEKPTFKKVMKDFAMITMKKNADESAKLLAKSYEEQGKIIKTLKLGLYAD